MESLKKQIVRHIHGLLTMQEIAKKSDLNESIKAIQSYQKLRFLDTHQSLYKTKNNNPILIFLAEQLFGSLNFNLSLGDPIENMDKSLRYIPKDAQKVLAALLQLKALCLELDFDLAQRLKHSEINADTYDLAYVAENNYALRQKQIEAINTFHQQLHFLTRIRGISFLFFIYQKPAYKLGFQELFNTMKKGYESYQELTKPDEFINTLMCNETQVMQNYFQTPPVNQAQN